MKLQMNESYLHTSRGIYPGCWREDVYDRGARHCVWHGGECGVWVHLLAGTYLVMQEAVNPLGNLKNLTGKAKHAII